MKVFFFLIAGVLGIVLPTPVGASETITYSYDALGRLVQVVRDNSQSDDWNVQITYDKAGNRINYTSTDTTTPGGGGNDPPPAVTYKARVVFNGRFYVSIRAN